MASQYERDQDKKAAEIGIKLEREKVGVPKLNYKGEALRAENKKKVLNQKIVLKLFDPNGTVREGCTWEVPRCKLTPTMLQELVSRSPLPGTVDCVQNMTTQELVLPENMQIECMPRPYEFQVLLRRTRIAEDILDDPHFAGYMKVVIASVPKATNNGNQDVTADDIRTYLHAGMIEEHPDVHKAKDTLERTQNEITRIHKAMQRIREAKPLDDEGNPLPVDEADAERQNMYNQALKEKEMLENRREAAKQRLIDVKQEVKDIDFDVEFALYNKLEGTCSWHLAFDPPEEDDEGNVIGFDAEKAVVRKNDWDGIQLAGGFEDIETNGPADPIKIPPWAGRGDPPDGSKEWEPCYDDTRINMKGALIKRVQHGIGLYKSLKHHDVEFYGHDYSVYHGQWVEGRKHGLGQMYSDNGIYSGEFQSDQIRGYGFYDYPHGCAYKGHFGTFHNHRFIGRSGKNKTGGSYPFEPLPKNPYKHGLPNTRDRNQKLTLHEDDENYEEEKALEYKPGIYTFADGGVYEGEFHDGRVCGEGKYTSSIGEVSEGTFKDGVLHGKGSFKDMLGNRWEGFWKDGQLWQDGEFVGRNKDVYKGTWMRHEKHGKGFERYRNGNQSLGFYMANDRQGHGVLWHGHVRQKFDKKTQTWNLHNRRTYEGHWMAGRAASKGCDTNVKYKQRYFTENHRAVDKKKFLKNVYEIQLKQDRKTKDLKDKYYKLEKMVLKDITSKKQKIFGRQNKSAKDALHKDAFQEYDDTDITKSLTIRRAAVDKVVEKKKLTIDDSEDIVKHIELKEGAKELERKVKEEDDYMYKPTIVTYVQSEYEYLEEQRRLLNVDQVIQKAKLKIEKEEEDEAKGANSAGFG
jgi:hypothetical protein